MRQAISNSTDERGKENDGENGNSIKDLGISTNKKFNDSSRLTGDSPSRTSGPEFIKGFAAVWLSYFFAFTVNCQLSTVSCP